MTAPRRLLTQKDVCGVLQISRTTLWKILRRGELRPCRLRGSGATKCPRKRFDAEEVERYVRRCTK
jgi:predicted DNA-binding transcriptional regulator AlpA